MKIRKAVKILFIPSCLVIGLVLSVQGISPASAASTASMEYKKALATSLSVCYGQGYFNDTFTAQNYDSKGGVNAITKTNKDMPVPAGYGSATKKGCKEILSEALSVGGVTLPATSATAAPALEKLGYTASSTGLGGKCFYFTYKETVQLWVPTGLGGHWDTTSNDRPTQSVCIASVDNNGVIQSEQTEIVKAGGTTSMVEFEKGTGKVTIDSATNNPLSKGSCGSITFTKGSTKFTDFAQSVYGKLKSCAAYKKDQISSGPNMPASQYEYTLLIDSAHGLQTSDYGSVTATYTKKSNAASIATSNLLGVSSLSFTTQEKFALYQNYLVDYYQIDALYGLTQDQIDIRTGDDPTLGGYKEAKVYSNGSIKKCYVKATQNKNKSVTNVAANSIFGHAASFNGAWSYATGAETIDAAGIIDFMSSTSITSIGNLTVSDAKCEGDTYDGGTPVGITDPNPDPGSGDPDDPDDNTAESPCMVAGGSLGWILCPALDRASKAVSGIYQNVVSKFLVIDADLLKADDGGGSTYKGWKDFRNFANILFAIFFVFVILSQVTGIGLSNYGIKKTLPRLIMTVALVNLSFVICQLAVDVSNIVGSGVYKMFNGWAQDAGKILEAKQPESNGAYQLSDDSSGSAEPTGILPTIITALMGTGAIYVGVVTWEFWIIPLLLAVLGCAIGVIFFFLVLGVREAAAIILVIMSPIAIVCYALPNTKSLFDKWKKMFQGVLMAYPICGALMGGGGYAAALLLASGHDNDRGFMYMLIAMLIEVIPFFFLPSILRSSLSSIGNIGNMISQFGRNMSHGLQRGIRNSEAGKEAQRRLNMRGDRRAFNRIDRRLDRSERNWGKRSHSGVRTALHDANKRRREHSRMVHANRYNRSAMEDIRAGGGQELLEEGSTAYTSAMAKQKASEMSDKVAGYEAIYDNNPKYASLSELKKEHAALLSALDLDPENRDNQAKLRAVQNKMMEKKGKGIDAIYSNLAEHMAKGGKSYAAGSTTGASIAGSHLMGAYAGNFKDKNQAAYNLIGDLQERDYSSNDFKETTPGSGKYTSDYYTEMGGRGWTAETLATASTGARDGIVAGIKNGTIHGQALNDLVAASHAAFANEAVYKTMDDKDRNQVRSILAAGYSANSKVWNPSDTTATSGSHAMGGASAQMLGQMATRIGEMGGATKTYTAADSGTAEYKEIQGMAENARRALQTGEFRSQEQADQANAIISAAASKGVADAAGNIFKPVSSTAINIPGHTRHTVSSLANSMAGQYTAGSVASSMDPNQVVNTNDFTVGAVGSGHENSIASEHLAALNQLAAATTQQEREEAQIKVSATQNVLSQTGAGQNAMLQNLSTLSGSSVAGMSGALQFAGQQLTTAPHASAVAQGDGALSSVAQELSTSGTLGYSMGGVSTSDAYSVRAASQMSANNLANMNSEARTRTVNAINSSTLTNDQAATFAQNVGGAFHVHNASFDSAARTDFQDIAANVLSTRNGGHNIQAARSFASSGNEGTAAMTQWINANKSDPRLVDMGQNFMAAYKTGGNSADTQANLKAVLKALTSAGVANPLSNGGGPFDPDLWT